MHSHLKLVLSFSSTHFCFLKSQKCALLLDQLFCFLEALKQGFLCWLRPKAQQRVVVLAREVSFVHDCLYCALDRFR